MIYDVLIVYIIHHLMTTAVIIEVLTAVISTYMSTKEIVTHAVGRNTDCIKKTVVILHHEVNNVIPLRCINVHQQIIEKHINRDSVYFNGFICLTIVILFKVKTIE